MLTSTMLLGAVVAAAPTSADVPRGTDLVIWINSSELQAPGRQMWEALEPVLNGWPPIHEAATQLLSRWTDTTERLEAALGRPLFGDKTRLCWYLDLDAAGVVPWAAAIRGLPKPQTAPPSTPPDGVIPFAVDGHPAFRVAGSDLAWSELNGLLLVGNEQGLQRQIRHALGGASSPTADPTLLRQISRLRRRAPVMAAFAWPTSVQQRGLRNLPNFGPLLEQIEAGSLRVRKDEVYLQLRTGNPDGQEMVAHLMRAVVALVRGVASLVDGGAETLAGLALAGQRPAPLPKTVDVDALFALTRKWLADFTVDAHVQKRPRNEVETTMTISSMPGLLVALGVIAIISAPTATPTPAPSPP